MQCHLKLGYFVFFSGFLADIYQKTVHLLSLPWWPDLIYQPSKFQNKPYPSSYIALIWSSNKWSFVSTFGDGGTVLRGPRLQRITTEFYIYRIPGPEIPVNVHPLCPGAAAEHLPQAVGGTVLSAVGDPAAGHRKSVQHCCWEQLLPPVVSHSGRVRLAIRPRRQKRAGNRWDIANWEDWLKIHYAQSSVC